jgi:transcriptional regulator with XRE-family HTH domain
MEELTLKQRLGQIIHNNRLSKKQSQKDLSISLNYSQSMISRIEKGYEDLNLEVYLETLNKLGLFYDLSTNTAEQINVLIEEIYQHSLYMDLEKIEAAIITFNQFMPNCLYYYDYLAAELVELYFQGNEEECETILKECQGNENLCHKLNQKLIHYIRLILESKIKQSNFTWEPDLNKPEIMDALDYYTYGVVFYNQHQYSKALMHLLYAIDQSEENKNIKRMSHAEVVINKMLMKDHDYFNLKLRLQDLFKHNQIGLMSDGYTLQFQMAYCLYYLKEYEKALAIFQTLQNKEFEYVQLVNYMIFKSCEKLQVENPIQVNIRLFDLYKKYQNNEKDDDYYQMIEQFILPHLQDYLEIKEYQIYAVDLMDHYFDTKKYSKFKKISEKINHIYKII